MTVVGGGLFGLAFFGFFALWVVGFVFWIVKLVEVIRIPDFQYRAAGTDKLAWVLVVVLASYIGALVWHFAKRPSVLAAAGHIPPPPPGWYPDQSRRGLRWWDGYRWTDSWFPPPGG